MTTTNIIYVFENPAGFGSNPKGLVFRDISALSHCVKIASRAPLHLPGPVKRNWYGVQGPKKHENANLGSVINIFSEKKKKRHSNNNVKKFNYIYIWVSLWKSQWHTISVRISLYWFNRTTVASIYYERTIFFLRLIKRKNRLFRLSVNRVYSHPL